MLRTERGYNEPSVRQLAIYLQNRVGQLGELLRTLEKDRLQVHSVSIADSVDFAVVRLIVDDVSAAKKVLDEAGFSCTESQLLAVELPDETTGLLHICRALIGGEVNIHYAYPMLTRPHGKGVMLVRVDDMVISREILQKRGFILMDEVDLNSEDSGEEMST